MNATTDYNKLDKAVAVVLTKMTGIETDIREIKKKLDDDYVTQDQFEPVKRIVYGLVSTILLTVVGALLALVIMK